MNVQELKAKLEAVSTKHTYWNPVEGFMPKQIVDLETIFKLLDEAAVPEAKQNIFEKIEEIAVQLQNGNRVTVLCDKQSVEHEMQIKLMRDRTYLTEGELFYMRIEDEDSVERYGITHPKQIAEFVREKIIGNAEITEILEIEVLDTEGAKKEEK